jgi:hypothetical protein
VTPRALASVAFYTIASVARELHHDEVQQEDNLLIEAVSLLVQRQRETESWLSDQMSQSEARASAVERRYGDLEARLVGIEDQLERLVRELEPPRNDPVSDLRLARLREQVEDLRSDTDGRPGPAPARPIPPPIEPVPRYEPSPARYEPVPVRHEAPRTVEPAPVRHEAPHPVEPEPVRTTEAAPARAPVPAESSVLEVMGPRPQDRMGFILIGIGLIVLLFALLTQLHF